MKERTKSKLKDIARDLIRLYAARKDEKGHAFAPDSYLQQELEASFIYEDTPDQLTATKAVKADMESDRPMDRLICGDVGFGKTEIAIRAAFKAAVDGKQTAVLVPTTVLAYQHFNTFRDRLKELPVRVDYISRARTPKQVREIISDLAEGKIDILIGTHKLIGKDVRFKGSRPADCRRRTEIRRGRQRKAQADEGQCRHPDHERDPHPRTLQFSLMGARDLTSLNTPRQPAADTSPSVAPFDDDLARGRQLRTLAQRAGVHDQQPHRSRSYELEAQVKRLVPDARVIVAHGQMPPEKLEKAIIDFANHDYDVLIATTIVENGIDMPNVNTIIVNNAQNFGLSELHSAPRSVGRSNAQGLLLSPGAPTYP